MASRQVIRRVVLSRYFLLAPLAFSLFGQPVQASIEGLNATGYIIESIPPSRDVSGLTTCGNEIENNINRSFDGEPFQQCPEDLFMVHYEGFITIPEHQSIQFWIASDDGGTVKIGTEEFGVWQDQGCSATESGYLSLDAGSQRLDGWFYENGGSTCYMLAWNIDDQGWSIVPDEAFSRTAVATTTTQPSTTTTTSTTTTSLVPDSIPETTQPATETPTTDRVPPLVVTSTTEAPSPTSLAPAPPSTVVEVSTSIEETTTTTMPMPTSTEIATTTSLESSTTTIAPAPVGIDPEVNALIADIEELSPAEIETKVADIIDEGISDEEANLLATSAEVLEAVTGEQATEIFSAINEDSLSVEEGAAIVAAVQTAPATVREAFEEAINVFGGATDTYVPLGSRVPVRTRRVIIITTGILVAMPSPARRRI